MLQLATTERERESESERESKREREREREREYKTLTLCCPPSIAGLGVAVEIAGGAPFSSDTY